jgi:DsbC/DsbD-like thiol-disulfide interchange protein
MKAINGALGRWIILALLTLFSASAAEDKLGEMPSPPEMKIAQPTADERVSGGAAFGTAEKNRVPVFFKVRMAPGFHIYSLEAKAGSANKPTHFELEAPDGVRSKNPWRGPKPKRMSDGAFAYEEEAIFWTLLDVSKDAKAGPIKIKMTFQACNEVLCWLPETIVRELQFQPEAGRK